MNFTSDNIDGIHPAVMDAINQANQGKANAYGECRFTTELRHKINEVFETDATIFLTATGTGANAVAMSAICKKYGFVASNHAAHIYQDETGAPEALMGGGRIIPVSNNLNGKVTAQELEAFMHNQWKGSYHHMQISAVSITNLTEHGVAYSSNEVQSLSDFCKSNDLYLHMDGARFTNAIVSQNCTPAEITWKSGVDILSLGFTKLGAMAAEMLVVFNQELAKEITYLHKRGGQLLSKSRFSAAQFLGFLEEDEWLKSAERTNLMAKTLEDAAKYAGHQVIQPVDGNQVFIELQKEKQEALRNAGAKFHVFPSLGQNACRFVISWNTQQSELNDLIKHL